MDITGHLNEVYLQLKGAGRTILAFLGNLAVFQATLLPLLSATLDTQRSCPHSTASAQLKFACTSATLSRSSQRNFGNCRTMDPFFLIKPDSFDENGLDLSQHFQSYKSSCCSMIMAGHDHGTCIRTCWISLPEKLSCLNNIALTLLTVFRSMDFCEQISSYTCMMFMLLPQSFDS